MSAPGKPAARLAEPAPPERPIQRVGHIGYEDNRFCGAAVFAELAERIEEPIELLCLGFGMPPLDADGREVLRCIALCGTSPDARVWPLKMTRILSSYGNSFAGFFGAQLANFSDRMGPGTASHAAASLRWLRDRLPAEPTLDEVRAAVAEHLATRGRIAGFGVPFRQQDERLLGMYRLLAGHPARQGAAWRLHLQVVEAMRALEQLEPNIVIAFASLLADLGLPAERTGLFISMMMSPTFAAHAVEASLPEGALLRELAAEHLEDGSRPPRRSPRAQQASERRQK